MIKQLSKRLVSFAQALRIRQMLAFVVAGLLLISSTACGTQATARTDAPGNGDVRSLEKVVEKPNKDLYGTRQPPQQGMNRFNDDPQYDNTAPNVKARQLIDRAKANLQRGAEDPADLVGNIKRENPVAKGAKEFSRNVEEATSDLKDSVTQGVQKGRANLKRNVEKAGDQVPQIVDQAKQNARSAGEDIQSGVENLQQGASNVGRGLQQAADEVKRP